MKWEKILIDSVKDGTIRALHLSKIPRLKTCDNWKDVEPIGWVDHKLKFAHYKGGLVKLNDNIYFVTDQTLNALSEFVTFKFPQKITVIED